MYQPIFVALIIVVALALAWRITRKQGFLKLSWFWLSYAGYEFLMYQRILCSGDCNIRIDLLLIYPALVGSTLWVVIVTAIGRFKRRCDDTKYL